MKELNSKTFGETPENFKHRLAFALQQEEKPMGRKWSVGLALAVVLALIAVAALAAVLLGGKDFVQRILSPKAQENQSQYWTGEEVAEILRIAGENGLSLSGEQQDRLLQAGGYPKEELMRLFVKLDLGLYPSTWSIEDQVWYGRTLVDIGLIDRTCNTLPEEGEATEAEVLAALRAFIQQQYDPDAPLADETVYRRHTTYAWTQVNPGDNTALEKQWFVEYEPLDLTHPCYTFFLDVEANILEARVEPGLLSRGELPSPDALLERYERLHGKFSDWDMETWVGFRQQLRDAAAVHGFGNSVVLRLLSLSEFGVPREGEKTKEEAVSMAMAAITAQEGIQESGLLPHKAYGVYLLDDEEPVWKVTIPAAREGNYIAEVLAQTGEARNILFTPLHGSGSIARSFMLESVYLVHHTETEPRAGTLCFEGRLASAKPLRNGDFLLYGGVWVSSTLTDAWAARVSPNGHILWEVRNGDGWHFDTAVASSDGSFLLAMIPKRGEPFALAVVTLDANGRMLGDPVTLEAEGFAYEGKDCLLVHRLYDTGSRTPPYTLLAVNGRGEILWERTYAELKAAGGHPRPVSNGYMICGMAQEAPFNQSNVFGMLARLDDRGNLLWKRDMKLFNDRTFIVNLETGDGGMLCADTTDVFVARFDAEGTLLWRHTYPQLWMMDAPNMFVHALLPAPDDGFLVIAQHWREDRHMFIRLDSEGNVLTAWWQRLADFPLTLGESFLIDGQIYLVFYDKAEHGPSNNTYVAPFLWPEDFSSLEMVELLDPKDMPSNG